jgi:kynurenine 3-monooxygenase
VLIGDASHAIVPFFGQGMNAGFEDAKELAAQLAAHAPAGSATKDYAAAFAAFSAARKPNADAIADMALENYVEMRASTADPAFRKRKAVENAMENSALGSRFRSRYAMVCYGGAGGVTYAAAQALGAVQWQIVGELADGVSSAEAAADELDLGKAEALLDEKLAPLQRKLQVDLDKVSHHE